MTEDVMTRVFEATDGVIRQWLTERLPETAALPGMHWSVTGLGDERRLNGRIGLLAEDPAADLAVWVAALDLGEVTRTEWGSESAEGSVDGVPVKVWYIADRTAFYQVA